MHSKENKNKNVNAVWFMHDGMLSDEEVIEQYIDVIPEIPGKAVCPVHGEYTFKYAQMPFGNKCIAHSTCMKCISERNDFIDKSIQDKPNGKFVRLNKKSFLNDIKIFLYDYCTTGEFYIEKRIS